MTPTSQARAALELASIPAATDAQVTRCIALAAWYATRGVLDDGIEAWERAAAEVAAEMAGAVVPS